jgi:uncharacterized protein (DUF885 family)
MTRFSHGLICGLALTALGGCGAPSTPASTPSAKAAAVPERLGRIVERYWDERLAPQNGISPQYLADSLSIERRYLGEVLSIPRDGLDANSRRTYDIFVRQRQLAIEGFTFPSELLPLNPFDGKVARLAAFAADTGQRPLTRLADYDDWLRRIDEYVGWAQQSIVNMRDGVRRGYTLPRALVERMLPVLERLATDESANVYYTPLRSMPESIKEPERSRLTKELSAAVSEKLLPANRALHDFLQHEYLPRARASLALSDMPLGSPWYGYLIKRATGAALSPDEIHRTAIAEVERIGARTPPPREAQGTAPAQPTPPAQSVSSAQSVPSAQAVPVAPNALLSAYRDLEARVLAALPNLFAQAPQADLDILGSEWLPKPAMPLSYQRAGTAGMPAAVLHVATSGGAPRAMSTAGFLQQAWPGHHYQYSLQIARADLPRFRRFGDEPAFVDGWGMYAASLGDELGVYGDEAAKSDAAAVEMRCAVGAVIDTGIQAKGWTRAKALDYLHAHLGIDELDAQALIDWYVANPADALACMIGELKIRSLRTRAQQLLAGRFDVRDFHTEILQDGAMPLDILEAKVKTWTDAPR